MHPLLAQSIDESVHTMRLREEADVEVEYMGSQWSARVSLREVQVWAQSIVILTRAFFAHLLRVISNAGLWTLLLEGAAHMDVATQTAATCRGHEKERRSEVFPGILPCCVLIVTPTCIVDECVSSGDARVCTSSADIDSF